MYGHSVTTGGQRFVALALIAKHAAGHVERNRPFQRQAERQRRRGKRFGPDAFALGSFPQRTSFRVGPGLCQRDPPWFQIDQGFDVATRAIVRHHVAGRRQAFPHPSGRVLGLMGQFIANDCVGLILVGSHAADPDGSSAPGATDCAPWRPAPT